ncbi:hypothetical protein M427DRAFT_56578 [Gonapodya prolifera JEL478]|uniref:Hemerythrin-like domain-containing protein n=1 Tax=Gonapodya prolifera (strain JEL478) TaxID=1344416 RepID=A0A139AH65_GONPJ|nr:hypothetical protein M427DRAFT_56578 [Gonapodya prolifera JEL478]|eukprot:KXS15753.1 hypothetical protein M427DRAFT_56578 [Gonapodya prolifera JEL478]
MTGSQGPENKAQRATIYDLIKRDHEVIRDLHHRYLAAHEDANRISILKMLIRETSLHAAAEDLVVYPALKQFSHSLQEAVHSDPHRSRNEHRLVETQLLKLETMLTTVDTSDKHQRRFMDELMSEAMTMLDKHMRSEERHDLVYLAKALPDAQLQDLGEIFVAAKRTVDGLHFHDPEAVANVPVKVLETLPGPVMEKFKELHSKFHKDS